MEKTLEAVPRGARQSYHQPTKLHYLSLPHSRTPSLAQRGPKDMTPMLKASVQAQSDLRLTVLTALRASTLVWGPAFGASGSLAYLCPTSSQWPSAGGEGLSWPMSLFLICIWVTSH